MLSFCWTSAAGLFDLAYNVPTAGLFDWAYKVPNDVL